MESNLDSGSRMSTARFLDMPPLRAARYLRFLIGKSLSTSPTSWWQELDTVLVVLVESVDGNRLAEVVNNTGRTAAEETSRLASGWNELAMRNHGRTSRSLDDAGANSTDRVWCATFGDNIGGAVSAADQIVSLFKVSHMNSASISMTVAIGKHEYAARSVLERSRENAIYLDKECMQRLNEIKLQAVIETKLRAPNNKQYVAKQRRLLRQEQAAEAFEVPARM